LNLAHANGSVTLRRLFQACRKDELVSGLPAFTGRMFAQQVGASVLAPDCLTPLHQHRLLMLLYLLLSNCQGPPHRQDCAMVAAGLHQASPLFFEQAYQQQELREVIALLLLEFFRAGL
jgi:hypothetical protein